MKRRSFTDTPPTFDAARINHLRVDKYSTVMVDQSRYSVPDHLVGEMVKVKSLFLLKDPMLLSGRENGRAPPSSDVMSDCSLEHM
ncbi:hypothetical protein KHA80_13190 [Anaerobacillus sp. HL2]|nr:hypothetical protein KHA80_13190 [Anaerobacillus sp. HL2]